jgi:hypothetical protein
MEFISNPGIYARDLKAKNNPGFSPEYKNVGLKPIELIASGIPGIPA